MLVFGLKSDKVRKNPISKGNALTFQQDSYLVKTEESTRAQMQVIRQGEQNTELYSIVSKKRAASFEGSRQAGSSKHSHLNNEFKHRPSTSKQKYNSNSLVVSDAETSTAVMPHSRLHMLSARTARKQCTSRRYA